MNLKLTDKTALVSGSTKGIGFAIATGLAREGARVHRERSFGLRMALYFASQGAGRLLWPLLANLTRLAIAAGGGWLALRASSDLSHVFLALSVALTAFGLINAGAVAGG